MAGMWTGANTEAVFVAETATELDRAAELLDAHGIEFTTTRSAYARPFAACTICEGTVFHVLARQAAFCRDSLAEHGLLRGVLPAGAEEVAPASSLAPV